MALRAVSSGTGRVRSGSRGGAGFPPFPALSGPSVSATNLDPAGATANNVLSNGNLTVSGAANPGQFVRTVMSVSSGKYECEFTVGAIGSGLQIGLADTTAALNAAGFNGLAGTDKTLGLYPGDGSVYCGSSFGTIGTMGASFTTGDKIRMCVDVGNRRVWFRKNNTGNWNNSGTANPSTNVGGFNINGGAGSGTLSGALHVAIGQQGGNASVTLDPTPASRQSGFSGWASVVAVSIDVALFMGQSNAYGTQTNNTISWRSDPNILCWHNGAVKQYIPNTQTGIEWTSPTGQWAAESEYARLYRAANPNKFLAIFKWTASGTQLYQSADGTGTYDWNPSSAGELFPQAGTACAAFIAALTAAGYTPTIRFVDWMQGETDASDSTMAAAYQTNLAALVAGLRNASGSFKVPAASKIAIGRVRNNGVGAATVRTAEANIAAADTGGPQWIYDTDDLAIEADFVHYTNAGQIARGARLWAVDQGTYTQP